MMVTRSTDAIVEAECTGRGVLPWMWVLIDADSAAVIGRSEPMFRTRAVALRVGHQVLSHRHPEPGRARLSIVS